MSHTTWLGARELLNGTAHASAWDELSQKVETQVKGYSFEDSPRVANECEGEWMQRRAVERENTILPENKKWFNDDLSTSAAELVPFLVELTRPLSADKVVGFCAPPTFSGDPNPERPSSVALASITGVSDGGIALSQLATAIATHQGLATSTSAGGQLKWDDLLAARGFTVDADEREAIDTLAQKYFPITWPAKPAEKSTAEVYADAAKGTSVAVEMERDWDTVRYTIPTLRRNYGVLRTGPNDPIQGRNGLYVRTTAKSIVVRGTPGTRVLLEAGTSMKPTPSDYVSGANNGSRAVDIPPSGEVKVPIWWDGHGRVESTAVKLTYVNVSQTPGLPTVVDEALMILPRNERYIRPFKRAYEFESSQPPNADSYIRGYAFERNGQPVYW